MIAGGVPWRNAEATLCVGGLFALVVILAVISAVPPGAVSLGPAMPFLPAAAVFQWSLYRPDLMPRGAAFLIGVMHDALTGAPLGVSAVALLVLQDAVRRYGRYVAGRAVPAVWLAFAAFAALSVGVSWLVASVWHLRPMPVPAAAAQLALTVASYPFVAWLFWTLLRRLAPEPALAPPR